MVLLGLTSILTCSTLIISPIAAQNLTNNNPNLISRSSSEAATQEDRQSDTENNIVYNPPVSSEDRGTAIKSRTGSGIRGLCFQNNLPQTLIAPQSEVGLTTQSHPQLSIYFAEIPKLPVSINIEDPTGMKVLWMEEIVVDRAGVYTFTVPKDTPDLIPGKEYDWTVALICDRQKRRRDIFAAAPIIRVSMSEKVKRELSLAESDVAKAQILAREGLFYDAVAELTTSNDDRAKNLLLSLLNQVDLVNLYLHRPEIYTINLEDL